MGQKPGIQTGNPLLSKRTARMQIRDIILGAEISVLPDPVWRQICRCTVMKTSFNLHFTTRSNAESDDAVNYKPESRVPELFYAVRYASVLQFSP